MTESVSPYTTSAFAEKPERNREGGREGGREEEVSRLDHDRVRNSVHYFSVRRET